MDARMMIKKLEEIAEKMEIVLLSELKKLGYEPDYLGVALTGDGRNNVSIESDNCLEISKSVKELLPKSIGVLVEEIFYEGDEDVADTITLIYQG